MSRLTTAQLRDDYSASRCRPSRLRTVSFPCSRSIRSDGTIELSLQRDTVAAWRLFADVMRRHRYLFRESAGGTYNCRPIAGTNRYSLHAYGLALDLNPSRNPWHTHTTDQPRAFRDAAKGIRTTRGVRVFAWGGDWPRSEADPMHWQVDATRAELARGVTDPGASSSPSPRPRPPTRHDEDDAMLPLRKGDGSGSRAHKVHDVQALQYLLNHAYGCKLDADGKYGPATVRAVRAHLSRGSSAHRGDAVDGTKYGRLLWQAGDRNGRIPDHGRNPRHTG